MKYRFATIVLALCAMALPCIAADAPKRDDSASEKLGIKLSLQCWTYNHITAFEAIDKAAMLGIKYVEFFPGQKMKPDDKASMSQNMSDEQIAEVNKKLADAGVKAIAWGVDGIPTDEAGARKRFENAKKLGLEVLVTETTPNEVIDKLANEFKIRVALHNHPNSWPPEKVLEATKDLSKMCGSCSDIGHWMTRHWVPVEQLQKLTGRVEHSHLKDRDQIGGGHDVVFGEGKSDLPGIFAELKKQGFKGYMSIEFEYKQEDINYLDTTLAKCVAGYDKMMGEVK